jgi:lipid II:glycine glycyltransferase (peptidoglycan interpeptide bridge formation enzyme)
MPIVSRKTWDAFIERWSDAHLLQTSAWGKLKSSFGWEVVWLVARNCGAQVLFRHLPLGFSIAYIPKGPVGKDWSSLWPEVNQLCKKYRAIFLKVEPDLMPGQEKEKGEFFPADFQPNDNFIQPARTIMIDLDDSEKEILARMKQKTRYNIRLAEKKGVIVDTSSNVDAFYTMMEITGERDEFGVHSLSYYRRAYAFFYPQGACELFIARYGETPLAGIMVFSQGKRAWYFYGASNNQERNRMPTYLLQWEAIRWARQKGCRFYDLWGVPDADEDELEAGFTKRSDGLWGVYRFKRGFGGELVRSIGVWDKVYVPSLYRLYHLYNRMRGG